ncbi:MAG: radical SAM protein [Candidatus Komeilibacteria bacterium]|jgi:DNA repair photolyase|nr:radical SAM protein [Candidatus Komeilibacteria bacterium]MBT4447783.1 radical SAM protein [Candidatus Komeilibacteria bacterium]
MSKINIQENTAKTILSKSKIPGTDYVINPYVGCLHGCKYCYASFMKRYTGHLEDWGCFLDIKMNAPELIEQELLKKKPKTVMLSSVTDPYNPLERKYKITRQILKILLKHQIPVSILTKSDLITRDIDLLKQFKKIQVGFSFFSLDNKDVKNFENFSSTPVRRIQALKKLNKHGINTYAFVGPILPYITNLEKLFAALSEANVDFVYCDKLNDVDKAYNRVKDIIDNKYPYLSRTYPYIFKQKTIFWTKRRQYIRQLSDKYQLKIRILFK